MTAPRLGPWVIGLDLALTSSGIAHGAGGVEAFKPPKGARGMARLDAIVRHVAAACARISDLADLVVVEGYFTGSKSAAVIELAELGGIIRHQLHCAGQPWIEVPPATLKIYATGSGNADKTGMVVAARERLAYGGIQADEADALWLRAFGHDLLGAPLVVLPKLHRRALDAVTLPPEVSPWPHESTAAPSGRTSRTGIGP
jgi:Holliday junction resolvasome RuvABC endonuclease subunit